jgi:hypothetical protein
VTGAPAGHAAPRTRGTVVQATRCASLGCVRAWAMRLRKVALVVLVVAGAALGAATTGGFVGKAPAGPQPPPPVKHYDPLP